MCHQIGARGCCVVWYCQEYQGYLSRMSGVYGYWALTEIIIRPIHDKSPFGILTIYVDNSDELSRLSIYLVKVRDHNQ